MKVYVIYEEHCDFIGQNIKVFSSKEKAEKYILEQYPGAKYNDDVDFYEYGQETYDIQEWEVE